MSETSDYSDNYPLDVLARRVRSGIETKGIHLAFEDELSVIWRQQGKKSGEEKELAILNFATVYGFQARVSVSGKMALFREEPEQP